MTEFVLVVTTADTIEEATALADGCVEARLAGCAQVVGPVRSTYWWDGAMQTSEEWQCVLKATTAGYPALERHLRERHSYEVPEIICTPIVAGNPDYLAWVAREATGGGTPDTEQAAG